jgi:hypothetical protein
MSDQQRDDNQKGDESGRVERAEARRSKAQEASAKSTIKLATLLVQQRLANNPAHVELIAKDKELRSELHQVRLRASKKRMRLLNILNESFQLAEDLLSLHTNESAILDELDDLRSEIFQNELSTHQHVILSLPRQESFNASSRLRELKNFYGPGGSGLIPPNWTATRRDLELHELKSMREEISEEPATPNGARSLPGAVGSTPMMAVEGLSDRIARPTPAMRPPPPMGTITASTSGTSSRISSPSVPCRGDDVGIVEVGDVHLVLRLGNFFRVGFSIVVRLTEENHLRAESAAVLHLHQWRPLGHDDHQQHHHELTEGSRHIDAENADDSIAGDQYSQKN